MPEPTVKGKPRSRNKNGKWRKKRSDAGRPRGPIKVDKVTTKRRTKAQRIEALREHIESSIKEMKDGTLLYMTRVKDVELLKDPEMREVLSANHVMILESILTRLGYLSPYK